MRNKGYVKRVRGKASDEFDATKQLSTRKYFTSKIIPITQYFQEGSFFISLCS